MLPTDPTLEELAIACSWRDCGTHGCLYNLTADPTEGDDLLATSALPPSPELASVLKHMLSRVAVHNASVFTPDRGSLDLAAACKAALENGGVWGPWLP